MESKSDNPEFGHRLGKTLSPRLQALKEEFEKNGGRYQYFKVGEVFEVKSSNGKINAQNVTFNGKTPYVVRQSGNNGIRGFIDANPLLKNEGNTISFGQDTATIFYQPNNYFTGDKIKVLKLKWGGV